MNQCHKSTKENEELEEKFEVFQYFSEIGYSGKLYTHFKKIKEGCRIITTIGLIILLVTFVLALVGDTETTWDDVGLSFWIVGGFVILSEAFIYFFKGFCVVVKNSEDLILERNRNKDETVEE